jgi:hypothetical protein
MVPYLVSGWCASTPHLVGNARLEPGAVPEQQTNDGGVEDKPARIGGKGVDPPAGKAR